MDLVFFDNFVNLCNKIGKPPTVVAVEMGFQKSVVTRWKKSTPTLANRKKIADYFGITVAELMQEETPAPKTGTGAFENVSSEDMEYIKKYLALGARNKIVAQAVIQSLFDTEFDTENGAIAADIDKTTKGATRSLQLAGTEQK